MPGHGLGKLPGGCVVSVTGVMCVMRLVLVMPVMPVMPVVGMMGVLHVPGRVGTGQHPRHRGCERGHQEQPEHGS